MNKMLSVRCVRILLPLCLIAAATRSHSQQPETWVNFSAFHYSGTDAAAPAPAAGKYINPILPGMYPDPSILRVGDDFYLVNSTFSWFPGVPIFHSKDLVHWRQIGSVLSRPSQLKLDGLRVSQGIYAPSIRYHDGVFYMVTTAVGGIGNFYVTATNPAGPWSDPIVLPTIKGIDPSFFFDDDGKAYIVHNLTPPDPVYPRQRAISLAPIDIATGTVSGPERILANGGSDFSKHPSSLEGPHLYHVNGYYYLMAAEGGTSAHHSEVIFRSRTLTGDFVPWEHNPILTQRDLDPRRPNPIACTGHADLVDDGHGNWWAVFLGTQPYAPDLENIGRETFMLPVGWRDGRPVFLPVGQPVPHQLKAPALPPARSSADKPTGSFAWDDSFRETALRPDWEMLRTPSTQWWSLTRSPGALSLQASPGNLLLSGNPSLLGFRQQHTDFTAAITVDIPTSASPVDAGLIAFQNENAYYYLNISHSSGAAPAIILEYSSGQWDAGTKSMSDHHLTRLDRVNLPSKAPRIDLKITGHGGLISFYYRTGKSAWTPLRLNADATMLSTAKAGGFVGTYLGPYARLAGAATP